MSEDSPLALPGFPRDSEGPVFKEPWQAKAFAMTLRLHERGLFTWSEWAQALAKEIHAAQAHDADLGDTYYQHWLRALEAMVARKGAATAGELAQCRDAWAESAERTPHGSPIELDPQAIKGAATQ